MGGYHDRRGGRGGDPYYGGGGAEERDAEPLRMEVPAEVAKMVIGAGGAAIRELQERTGAHVMIRKPNPGENDDGPRSVMIKACIALAKPRVLSTQGSKRLRYNGGGEAAAAAVVVTEDRGTATGREREVMQASRRRTSRWRRVS